MDNEFNVIDHERLNTAIAYHGMGDLIPYLCKSFDGQLIHRPWLALKNPHTHCNIEPLNLVVNTNTGYWIDRSCGDSGPDILSLVAYLFNLAPNKAALRIIEEMRLSHE